MDEQGFPTIFESMDERRIATAMHAQILHSHPDRRYARVSTDSRCVTGNEMFLALKGERFDAHDFLPQVFHAQCRGIVIDSAHAQTLTIPKEVTAFVVDDVLKAFGRLAAAILDIRRTQNSPFEVYAVTGSNGKTTTKEFLAALLAAKNHCVLKTSGNFNNHSGLPMTLMGLSPHHDVAVLEMGASGPGEIAMLSGLAKPDVAIITCVGASHLQGFGSIEGVAKAKGEMLHNDSLKRIVLPTSLQGFYGREKTPCPIRWVGEGATVDLANMHSGIDGIDFELCIDKRAIHIALPFLGVHNAGNFALAVAATGESWTHDELQTAIDSVTLPSGRLERWNTLEHGDFLYDAYNANPLSMRAALDLIKGLTQTGQNHSLILGDMLELGPQSDQFHLELGRQAAQTHPQKLLCVGASAHLVQQGAIQQGMKPDHICATSKDDLDAGLQWIQDALVRGSLCLIKGSRGIALERVLNFFQAVKR